MKGKIWILLTVCLCLAGCGSPNRGRQEEALKEVKEVVAEGVQESKRQSVQTAWDGMEAAVVNAGQKIENITSIDKSKLTFNDSLSDDRMEAYTDENGNFYFYKENGKMVQFISGRESTKSRALKASEEDVKREADLYLENLVDSSSYYQFESVEYNTNTNLYLVMYVHKVNGLDTNDLVLIGIDNDLNLTSFSVPRAYAFEGMEGVEVDEEEIKKEALDKYYQEHGDDIVDVEVESFLLGTDDDENICYQVAVNGNRIVEEKTFAIPDLVYIPCKGN